MFGIDLMFGYFGIYLMDVDIYVKYRFRFEILMETNEIWNFTFKTYKKTFIFLTFLINKTFSLIVKLVKKIIEENGIF